VSRAALACVVWAAGAVAVAMEAGAQVPRWQCSPTGARAVDPVLAEAAGEYLGRVEALYPYQALGLVRAGDRFYLLNSTDVAWGERTRLHLLARRLRESYLTAERQALYATPGSSPPPGGFVCLAAARAEREGLARTPQGEIVLAAGHSVHLVDPQEPEVAVEVRAAQNRSLNLGEIFRRSSRTGIYAGLTGPMSGHARQPGAAASAEPPDGTLIIRLASAGGLAEETRIETPAPVQDPAPVAVVPAAPPTEADRPAEGSGATVAAAEPVAPAPAAVPAESPTAPVAKSVPGPAASGSVVSRVRLPAANARPGSPPGAGQTYEEYAKAMKALLALRRTSAVRSISELTYVHPAVEMIRYQPR
jgi:hypothetical protein